MMKQRSHKAIVRSHDEAEQLWFFGGGLHLWKVTTADTGGTFSMFEDVLTKGKVTPLHCHAETDELVYVLEGELLVSVNGEQCTLGTGGVMLVPRGTPHALMVTSETARLLCFGTPCGSETFFRAASEPGAESNRRVDFDRVREAAVQTGGMVLLGPPPFKMP